MTLMQGSPTWCPGAPGSPAVVGPRGDYYYIVGEVCIKQAALRITKGPSSSSRFLSCGCFTGAGAEIRMLHCTMLLFQVVGCTTSAQH